MTQHERDSRSARPGEGPTGGPAGRSAVGRRAFLGLVGAGVATAVAGAGQAVAAPPGSPSVAPAAGGARRTVPRTLARPATAGPVRPGYPVEYVGVRWPAKADGVRIRLAGPDGALGSWRQVRPGCGGGRGDGAATAPATRSALVPAHGASGYQLDLPAGAAGVALNSTDGPPLALPVTGAERTRLAGRRYFSRAAWGADESLRFDETGAERYPQTYWPVQTLTVHHTATGNDDPDPAARMRAIYRFQTIDEDFGDFGYHFLIDEAGNVYEGRYSGEDPIPGFDAEGRMVNAAHVGGFNAGNVGIVLLGNFTDRAPTPAARGTLTLLLAAIAGWQRMDPLGTVQYVNPISGATRTVNTIAGHRDWAPTECPGTLLAADLQAIRQDVATLLGRSGTPGTPAALLAGG
jgi:hypothetical protein